MRQSQLFTKTRKEAPKDEVSKNAELLIRGGFIHKEMAGVYVYLPLGFRVLEKIKNIVREEMNSIGGQEIIMSALQRKELWERTDRWNDTNVDVWFKSKLKNDTEIGFGWSHEEPIADMLKSFVTSFRDLPAYIYQFQTKFRNELRAKSGIMRGREFVMKDLYSFSIDEKAHQAFYGQITQSYLNIFKKIGIGDDTFVTFASGGTFTQFSHEFQTITDAGEDAIYINKEKTIALNEEVMNDETLKKLGVKKEDLEKVKTAEVGNIFNFGTKKCEELGLVYSDAEGKKIPVWLGSYGIGITRLMGVVAEKFADEKGLVWPKEIAPFQIHLLTLGADNNISDLGDEIYKTLQAKGVEVLYDDRDARAGEKFADSDLLGIPTRVIVGEKTLESKMFEVKDRQTGAVRMLTLDHLLNEFAA